MALGRPARSRKAGKRSTARVGGDNRLDVRARALKGFRTRTKLLRYGLHRVSHVHDEVPERVVELEEQQHLTCSHT